MEIVLKQECYKIVGACFEVYKSMGCGFLESVYQECLELEFGAQKVPMVVKPSLSLCYQGKTLRHTFEPDFVCYDKIIVELKAVSKLADEHEAQVLNYLNVTGYPLGLLINFGHHPGVEHKRIVHTAEQRWRSEGKREMISRV